MVGEVGQHALEAADWSKTRGIIEMPTTVPDPPRVGGVKAAPEVRKERSQRTFGSVAERAIKRSCWKKMS